MSNDINNQMEHKNITLIKNLLNEYKNDNF